MPARPEPLFPVADLEPKKCSCGTTRKSLCVHDANVAHGILPNWATRPRSCLNRHDPSTAPLPKGY